jgi:acid stress-induced BolA-like protein IbaG/YrbA
MAKLTKERLKKILTNRLSLVDPEFHLEKAGSRLIGNVISESFKGKRDHQRQLMIWKVLKDELGPNFLRQVGLFLAYTPAEWNLGEEDKPAPRKRRKAG